MKSDITDAGGPRNLRGPRPQAGDGGAAASAAAAPPHPPRPLGQWTERHNGNRDGRGAAGRWAPWPGCVRQRHAAGLHAAATVSLVPRVGPPRPQ